MLLHFKPVDSVTSLVTISVTSLARHSSIVSASLCESGIVHVIQDSFIQDACRVLCYVDSSHDGDNVEGLEDHLVLCKALLSRKTTHAHFLNITIYKSPLFPHQLQFKLYSKSTASYQYMHKTSHHPLATKHAIIYGEALRVLRNTSLQTGQELALNRLKSHLRNRQYPLTTIQKMFTKARNYTPIPTCNPDQIFLKTHHESRRPTLKTLLDRNKNTLLQGPTHPLSHPRKANQDL